MDVFLFLLILRRLSALSCCPTASPQFAAIQTRQRLWSSTSYWDRPLSGGWPYWFRLLRLLEERASANKWKSEWSQP